MKEHIIWDGRVLRVLDQRLLPQKEEFMICGSWEDVFHAIRDMVVRGAPLIGVTAAFGCLLALNDCGQNWRNTLSQRLMRLEEARPTAINLAWAINRMRALWTPELSQSQLQRIWKDEAVGIMEEDRRVCHEIGKNGEKLVPDGSTVLTHCNAGALATGGYGTALGVIRAAVEAGKKIAVIADETRPFLQGARLTAWELAQDHIPVKIACDNSCAWLMRNKLIQLVITGADRIAANGDTANKIGTLGVAILANHYGIPFYIAAPVSTIDPALPDGRTIPIEERPEEETTTLFGQRLAPAGVPAFNFAFDVTPAELITAIITEKSILYPPYTNSIGKLLKLGQQ